MTARGRDPLVQLHQVAARNDAPPEVMRWLWETRGAPDRAERLDALRERLEASLDHDDDREGNP